MGVLLQLQRLTGKPKQTDRRTCLLPAILLQFHLYFGPLWVWFEGTLEGEVREVITGLNHS